MKKATDMSTAISEGYGHPPHPLVLSMSPIGGLRALSPAFGDVDDPIGEGEDPFGDPTSPIGFSLKPPPPPPPKRGNKAKAKSSSALPQNEGRKESKFEKRALANKSTNHLVGARPTTTTGVTYGSIATILPQQSKRETRPSPKIHQKKRPRLNPQITPQLVLKVEPPVRPRKHRQAGPSLEDQDFPAILSPSKARKPDYKSHFRKYSGISENGSDRPYNEPPTGLGISGIGMNDSIGTISGTWVREKAKGIFSGTKKAAEKILGVSPSSARYKCQQQKNEKSKLKDMVQAVIKSRSAPKAAGMLQKTQKERVDDGSISGTIVSELESSNGDVVSLQDFLEDPFSSPEDYELDQAVDPRKERYHPLRAYSTSKSNRRAYNKLWRTESIQDLLVLGSTKVQGAERAVTAQKSDPKYRTKDRSPARNWKDLSSFFATTSLGQGTAYEFNHSGSENEMPSSSPMAKSTPKKDWYRYGSSDSRGMFDLGANRRAKGNNQSPVRPKVAVLGSSGADRLEGTATEELLNDNGGNGYDEYSWDEGDEEGAEFSTKLNKNGAREGWGDHQEQHGATIRLGETKHPPLRAADPEDEFCGDPYGVRISGKDAVEEKDCYSLEMSIDGLSDEEDKRTLSTIIVTKTDVRDLQGVDRGQNSKGVIHTGGSRISKQFSKGKKLKPANRDERITASRSGGGGNRAAVSRVAAKKIAAKEAGRGSRVKEIRRRRPSLGYDRMEVGNDVDELQMDLPGMRI